MADIYPPHTPAEPAPVLGSGLRRAPRRPQEQLQVRFDQFLFEPRSIRR